MEKLNLNKCYRFIAFLIFRFKNRVLSSFFLIYIELYYSQNFCINSPSSSVAETNNINVI